MKILQVNQYYYPRGGADIYFLDLCRALENSGQEVAVFAMDHPKNLESIYSKYFVSRVSYNQQGLKDKLKTPGRVLYSLEAKRKFAKLLKDFQPDIIHCHNIYHHLSPSILDVAKKQNIPVVMHLHDYKLICPNHSLFTHNKPCEKCRPDKYYQCIKNSCVKNSLSASILASVEMYLHHNILKIYEQGVTTFIAPSNFMKNMAVSFGQDPRQIEVVYNPHNLDLKAANQEIGSYHKLGGYFLYFGRLSEEKGLNILIKAAAKAKQKIVIAGAGMIEADLKKLALDLKAPVEFVGFKSSGDLVELIRNSQAIIIPSICYENMPLSLLEALSLNKIALVSNIGGMPEVIQDGKNGYLFEAGNTDDLVDKINQLNNLAPDKRQLIETSAGETAKLFSPEKNLAAILKIYKRLTKTATD